MELIVFRTFAQSPFIVSILFIQRDFSTKASPKFPFKFFGLHYKALPVTQSISYQIANGSEQKAEPTIHSVMRMYLTLGELKKKYLKFES